MTLEILTLLCTLENYTKSIKVPFKSDACVEQLRPANQFRLTASSTGLVRRKARRLKSYCPLEDHRDNIDYYLI